MAPRNTGELNGNNEELPYEQQLVLGRRPEDVEEQVLEAQGKTNMGTPCKEGFCKESRRFNDSART